MESLYEAERLKKNSSSVCVCMCVCDLHFG